jgi:Zn-dependent protease with chaperone function
VIPSTVLSESLSVSILAVPALVRWLQGRRLVRQLDDPAFPELRLAAGQRLIGVVAVCLVAGLVLGPRFVALKLLVATVALFAADHASRKVIFCETRGVLAYLSHSMRFTLAMFGVWFLLALTPAVVLAAGPAGAVAAILLAVSSALWVHFGGHVFPALLRAASLDRPEVQPLLDRIIGLARCPRPVVLQADAPGGYWVNAFAIPSLHQPGVLFTTDLLRASTPAEIAAIFAHEIAHLEWYTRRRVLQRDLTVLLLSAIASTTVLWAGPGSAVTPALIWIWPLMCIILFVAAQSRQQALEHQSDLRALELTGDAEALVSSLTKIHHLLRLPRRWQGDMQAKQSHPSLAARLRAIREAAGGESRAPTSEAPPELVVRGAGAEAVVLTADHVHWLRGVPAGAEADARSLLDAAGDRRSIRYEDLSDLRLDVRGGKGRHLVAVDGSGTVLRIDLRPKDVAAVKDRLQRVDVRLPGTGREVTSAMQGESRRKWLGRIWGVFAVLLGLLPPFSLPLFVTGALVVWRPARATLAAAAAVGLGLLLVGHPIHSFELGPFALPFAAETVLGFVFLFELISRVRARIEDPASSGRRTAIVLSTLAAFYLVAGVGRLGSPLPWMQFHQWARFGYGLTLALLALAAATLTLQPRWRRALAVAPAMLAGLLLLGGTLWFRDRFGDDPLGERTAPLVVEDLQLERVRERAMDGYVTEVRISPTGERLATRRVREAQRFEIELPDGGAASLEALDLAFLDDRSVVRLLARGDGLTLETLRLGSSPEPLAEVSLPSLTMPRLAIDASGSSWEVTGTDAYRSTGMRLSGSFGSPDHHTAQWDVGTSENSYLSAMTMNAAPAAVAVMGRIDFDGPAILATYLGPFGGYTPVSEISLVEETGPSPIALTTMNVQCLRSAVGQTRFFCSTYDPEGVTRLWSIDWKARRLDAVGTLPGVFHSAVPASPGRALFVGFNGDPLWFDDNDRQVRRLVTGEPAELGDEQDEIADAPPQWFLNFSPAAFSYGARYHAADVRGRFIALAAYRDGASVVVVHRLPDRLAGTDPTRHARLGE